MSSDYWPAIILLSASAALLATARDVGPPLQPLIAFWFLLVCPGMAYVRLLNIRESLTEFTLAVGLSIAIVVLVSQGLVLTGSWSAQRALHITVIVSLVGVALQAAAVFHAGREGKSRRY